MTDYDWDGLIKEFRRLADVDAQKLRIFIEHGIVEKAIMQKFGEDEYLEITWDCAMKEWGYRMPCMDDAEWHPNRSRAALLAYLSACGVDLKRYEVAV